MSSEKPSATTRLPISLQMQFENLRCWLYLMVLALAGRLIWLVMTRHQIPPGIAPAEWARVFWTGFIFDAMSSTYLMLPLFLLGALLVFAPTRQWRVKFIQKIWMIALSCVIPLLAFANVSYYLEYANVFDAKIFEFFEGNALDAISLAVTDHRLFLKFAVSIGITFSFLFTYFKFLNNPLKLPPTLERAFSKRITQVAVSLLIVVMVAVTSRGSIGRHVMQRSDCEISPHRVLNLGTLNPYFNLKTAYQQHRRAIRYYDPARLIPGEQLVAHANVISQAVGVSANVAERPHESVADFDHSLWQRTAAGPLNARPSHVFVLFLESYDSWPFLKEYRELGLVDEGARLGSEGHLLLSYLPGANSSVLSSLTCIQGLLQTNRGEQECLPTSMVYAFKQLGYRARSVNGFPSGWADTERVAEEQGFDEIYCTAHIMPGGETSNGQVHDRTLYEFASEKLTYDQPTFSFIRSSSYHGPWEVDLEAENCTVGPLPEGLHKPGMIDEKRLRLAYGHLKYTDKVTSAFVRRIIKRHPDALFVITGDHYGHHYLTSNPSTYKGASVPLILYGPQVLQGTSLPKNMAASHIDLATTLIELSAPQGFRYTSVGKNILAPCSQPAGVGQEYVIFSESIVSLHEPMQCEKLPWMTSKPRSRAEQSAKIEEARAILSAYEAVGYMLSRRSLERNETQVSGRQGSTLR